MPAAWLPFVPWQPQRSGLARAPSPFASRSQQNQSLSQNDCFSTSGHTIRSDFYCPLRTQIRLALTEYVSGQMGFRGIESKSKSCAMLPAWKSQIIHGGGECAARRASDRERGCWPGSLALGCFAPCETCSVGRVASARAKRNKKVPKTSFFTFVGRFIGRLIQLPLKFCAVIK
jgi:hypothetical protein